MPQTPHVEKHFTASETVRDIVIGMSDEAPSCFGPSLQRSPRTGGGPEKNRRTA